MNIVMIASQWLKTTGGPSTHVNSLSIELRKMGNTVWIFSPEPGDGVICIGSNPIMKTWNTFRWLMKIKPDVVHIHGRINAIPAAVLYRFTSRGKCRVVFSFHTQPYFETYLEISNKARPDYQGVKKLAAKWLLHKCNEIISCSHSLIRNLNKYYQMEITRYVTLYTGAELEPPNLEKMESMKTSLGIGNCFPILTTIGVFNWDWKVAGHKICIEAIKNLINKYPNIRLLIVGRGEFEEYLIGLVRQMALDKHVIFLGRTESLREVFEVSDIYVHMALNEAMGLSLVEAMHANKPIIVANRGGLPELIEHNFSGIVVEPTADDLASAVINILKNDEFRCKLSTNSLIYAKKFLNLRYFAENTLQVYAGKYQYQYR